MRSEDGVSVEVTANIAEGVRDPDYYCSSACLVQGAVAEWMSEVDGKLRAVEEVLRS
jgi:hypothetical protein